MLKIAIASGKGGTGKTLLSTNITSYLAAKYDVLLADLDVEEPNDFVFIKGKVLDVSEQFKMIPEWDETNCTLCGLCSSICKFHAVLKLGDYISVFDNLCHSCYACSELCPSNSLQMVKHKIGETKIISSNYLTFIESRLNVGEEQAVPLINQTHDLINKDYSNIKYQFFDCPPGNACPLIASIKPVDFVILVAEPTPFGISDLKIAIETVRFLKKPLGVVINRYSDSFFEIEEYCEKENIPILTKINFDIKIAELYSKGLLLFDKINGIKNCLEEILEKIESITIKK